MGAQQGPPGKGLKRRACYNSGSQNRMDSRHRWPGAPASDPSSFFFFFFLFNCIYVEKESEHREGQERGRERIPSRIYTGSAEPNVGLNPLNGNQEFNAQPTEPPRCPQVLNMATILLSGTHRKPGPLLPVTYVGQNPWWPSLSWWRPCPAPPLSFWDPLPQDLIS